MIDNSNNTVLDYIDSEESYKDITIFKGNDKNKTIYEYKINPNKTKKGRYVPLYLTKDREPIIVLDNHTNKLYYIDSKGNYILYNRENLTNNR